LCCSLDIPGGQLQLIDAIVKTGVKTVVVLIGGRPATFGEDTNVCARNFFSLFFFPFPLHPFVVL
jgi:hypothetical protein